MTTIRLSTAADIPALAAIADETLFPGDMLADMLGPFLDGDPDVLWMTALHDDTAGGFSFSQVEPLTDGTWNMKALAVSPTLRRSGLGRALVEETERSPRARSGRLILIDTSSDPAQATARAFYPALGYRHMSTLPDFWSEGEDKLSYLKVL